MPIRETSIAVKHNIEVAHRLFENLGKCENIHGHSMWVTLELFGPMNDKGMLAGIEYGELKKRFRGFLDESYDHRLLLNAEDPFAGPIFQLQKDSTGAFSIDNIETQQTFLPGLHTMVGDPTTENIAKDISIWMGSQGDLMKDLFKLEVTVWETSVNMAKVVYGKNEVC